jgi:hypothetical protein
MKIARKRDLRQLLVMALLFLAALLTAGFDEPSVQVAPTDSVGPRTLEKQTETAVIRDYMHAWQTMSAALDTNQADLLDADFVGTAKDKLADTVREQQKSGLRTHYADRSHNLKLVFYSPEGLSIQLIDTVEYDVQLFDHDQLRGTTRVHARYVAVLTPTEVRWKVRLFQAQPE